MSSSKRINRRTTQLLEESMQKLELSEQRFALAQASGKIGVFDWNLQTNQVYWSKEIEHMLKLPPNAYAGTYDEWAKHVYPDDLNRMEKDFRKLFNSEKSCDAWEYRIALPDGNLLWIAAQASVIRDENGKAVRMIGTNLDITEAKLKEEKLQAINQTLLKELALRQDAEQSLHSSQELLQKIIDTIPVMIVIFDPAIQTVKTNKEYERLTGWNDSDFIDRDIMECCYPDKEYRETVREYMLSLETGWREFNLTCKDGSILPSEWANIQLSDDRCVGVGIDVRERKTSQEQLSRLAGIVDFSQDAIIRKDKDGIITAWNKGAETMYGYTRDEAVGNNITIIAAPQKRAEIKRLIDTVFDGETVENFQTIRQTKYNETIHISLTMSPIRNAQGDIVAVSAIERDITDQIQSQEMLRKSHEHYRALAELIPHMIWVADPDGTIMYANKQMLDSLGHDIFFIQQYGLFHFVHPQGRSQAEQAWQESLRKGKEFKCELQIKHYDGSYIWHDVHALPVKSRNKKIKQWFGTCTNNHERRQAREDLRKSEQKYRDLSKELEQRVAERSAVAEKRSEQLRQFALALTSTEQEERRALADAVHNHLQQLITAAGLKVARARNLVENPKVIEILERSQHLLQLSVDEVRKITIQLSPPILKHGTLKDALEWLAGWMEETYDMQVKVDLQDHPDITSDQLRVFLFDSVKELLFNSFKHSRTRYASLSLRMTDANELQIIVADNGQGCDNQILQQKQKAGDGFGIFSITERTEIFGGTVSFESVPGAGFKSCITLPANTLQETKKDIQSSQKNVKKKSYSSADGPRVMIVDDHEIFREGLVNILSEENFSVIGEAQNGEKALELVPVVQPQVIIMDVNMPVMNGIEATRAIKQKYPDVRIVGLSINNDNKTYEAMIDAGADAYCTKDDASHRLCSVIASVLPTEEAVG